MKKFYVNVIDQRIKDSALVAERLFLPDSPMMNEIYLKNDFKYDSGSGKQVFERIVTCDKIAPVFFYKPKWIFSKALGYSDGKAIYINLRILPSLSDADIIGLLCHEWLHYGPGFSHGSNTPSKEKDLHSVNYFVSSNIAKWL